MVSVLAFVVGKSQQYLPKDTLYGKVKTLREKVIFLTEITTPQFLDYEDDYGHTGFRGAKETLESFRKVWYTYDFCHYLNYKKVFDNRGNMIKETWFDKKTLVLLLIKETTILKIESSENWTLSNLLFLKLVMII